MASQRVARVTRYGVHNKTPNGRCVAAPALPPTRGALLGGPMCHIPSLPFSCVVARATGVGHLVSDVDGIVAHNAWNKRTDEVKLYCFMLLCIDECMLLALYLLCGSQARQLVECRQIDFKAKRSSYRGSKALKSQIILTINYRRLIQRFIINYFRWRSQPTDRRCGIISSMENKRVATYKRVSTKSQSDKDRLGLAIQEDAIAQICKTRGYTIVATYCDSGFSGTTADRPGLAAMLEDATKGLFEEIVVYKYDRLARSTMLDGFIRYQLKKASVSVVSATEKQGDPEDPVAALTAGVLAAVSQFEISLIRQRMCAARALKRSRGGYDSGRPAYGQRACDKSLVTNEDEVAVIELMRKLRSAGKSYGAIALALNARQILPRHAKHWNRATICQIIKRNGDQKTV